MLGVLSKNQQCTGVVLAGGLGSRFGGRAKGLVELGGQRLVDRVLDALRDATTRQMLVAKDVSVLEAALPGMRVVADVSPIHASLAGLHAALVNADGPALVVAWDMPFISAPLLRAIREAGELTGGAALPEGPRGLEPLCAYYPAESFDVAARQLARGELRLGAFVEALPKHTIVPSSVVSRFGDPELLFFNVNSPSDLAAAARRLANDATGAGDYLHARSPITEPR